LLLKSLEVGPLAVNCFLLACEKTGEGVVIDPGENVPGILKLAEDSGTRITRILATHGHFDHIGKARTLAEETGAPFAVHDGDRFLVENLQEIARHFGLETDPAPDIESLLVAGESITFGEASIGVRHTPGHSPGNVTFTWAGNAIVGDTVFAGSIGRTDFEGGNLDQLLDSIRTEIFSLGDDTQLHPGHGPATTVERERTTNPFLN
jgi:hydroxyacylglutathione hydrolase